MGWLHAKRTIERRCLDKTGSQTRREDLALDSGAAMHPDLGCHNWRCLLQKRIAGYLPQRIPAIAGAKPLRIGDLPCIVRSCHVWRTLDFGNGRCRMHFGRRCYWCSGRVCGTKEEEGLITGVPTTLPTIFKLT